MKKNTHINSNYHRRAGFTLIEILLVVVIISILAGIGIPAITGKSETARISQAEGNINAISSALAIYEMNNGTYHYEVTWKVNFYVAW